MKKNPSRSICIAVALIMALLPASAAFATSTSDQIKEVEQEQKTTKDQLGHTQDTIEQLKDSKEAIQNSLNNLNDQLDEKNEEISDIEDQIAEGGAHRHFHQADVIDLAAEREYFGAAALFRAVFCKGFEAFS